MISAFIEEKDRIGAHARIKEIFFLSSYSGAPLVGAAREKFFDCWAGYYLEEMPEHTSLFKMESGRIIGYLTGCLNSAAARPLYGSCFYYREFDGFYAEYPAHFHVNCDPKFRGRGVGKRLVQHFVSGLKQVGNPGVHLVTGKGARNRRFYERLGFIERATCQLNKSDLVLLGRNIRHE